MLSPRRVWILVSLIVLIGIARIASTLAVFSATADEATHIGAGLQLFEFGVYGLHVVNPPLPRVVMSVAPWLGGMRLVPHGSLGDWFHSVFYGHGDYVTNLVLARAGNLIFFALAAFAMFVWARSLLGVREAVIALVFFTTQPVILGYSGLATHDMAATAGLAVALVAFSRWLGKPNLVNGCALGVAYGFSILCKFSSIGFVPAACGAIAAVAIIHDRELRQRLRTAFPSLVAVPVVAFLVIWSGYAFTIGSFSDLEPWRDEFGGAGSRVLGKIDGTVPLPAPAFFKGIGEILKLDRLGHRSFLFGRTSEQGWWWYFPATVALKTTLPFLLLLLSGCFLTWRTPLRSVYLQSLAASVAILAMAVPSSLNIGVRYVLPLYVPATVAVTAAFVTLLRRGKAWAILAVALLILHVGSSLIVHPDYFPYFNLLAGRDPSLYLIDSNLDWGQDVLRLRTATRELKIDRIGLALMGPADYEALGFPNTYSLSSRNPSRGWMAVSDQAYRMGGADGGWRWLADKPYLRVGTSIRLYHLP